MRISRATAAFLALAWISALTAGGARAESGLTGAPILNRPIGARSSGMGRAFTAISGDAESVMYNPAGLAFSGWGEVYMAYMNGFAGGSYGLAAAPFKLGNLVLTPAFLYYNSGSIDLNLSDGTQGQVTGELDKVAMLSGSYAVRSDLAVGGTLKFTSINLAETASASAKHFDLGILYRPVDGLSFGAASLNNGGDIKFEEEGDPAPATLRAGAAYRFELNPPNLLDNSADVSHSELVVTSDWSRTVKEKGYFQAGAELNMKMQGELVLSLRAGYLFNRPEENVTVGLGVKSGAWAFNLGYEAAKDLNARMPVSLTWCF